LVADRSSASIARALREGLSRTASAPAVVIGTFAAARVFEVPSDNVTLLVNGQLRPIAVWLLFWSLVYGGVLDRFARNRPTRGHGFFAACGAHLMPLARLGAIVLLVELALLPLLGAAPPSRTAKAVVAFAVMIGGAVLALARIRLVVEDRRSAFGSLLAGARFVRRNPAAVVLFLLFGMAAYGVNDVFGRWADGAVGNEVYRAVQVVLKLIAYAAAIALFQSRLAHASYTAAPAAEWPESASAEAIANVSPGAAR
jgi:hypothetical protein